MREYRKGKHVGQMGAPASLPSTLSIMRAPEPLGVLGPIVEGSGAQPKPPDTRFARKRVRSSFKTALELARTFPFGVLASQVCPYCYNTGYSSPGTQCSYCRSGER